MKLYNRQLKSFEDLQNERLKLLEVLERGDKKITKKQNAANPQNEKSEAPTESSDGELDWMSLMGTATDVFLKPGLANWALSAIFNSKKSGKTLLQNTLAQATGEKLWSVGKTVIVGYAKWTALQWGVKWLGRLLKNQPREAAEES